MPTIVTNAQAQMTTAYADHAKGLRSHAFYKVSTDALSDDLVQDTYLKAGKYLARGGVILTMKGFLYHTMNALIIDHYRKKKSLSLDVFLERGFDHGSDPSDQLIDVLDGRQLQLRIMQLPVAYQRVMLLRHVRDLTLEQIATLTHLSKGTVAVQLHRGLAKLKLLCRQDAEWLTR